MASRKFQPGERAPDFTVASTVNPKFHFNTIGGRYILLTFLGSLGSEKRRGQLAALMKRCRHFFDDEKCAFFGVTIDPSDESQGRAQNEVPGIRYFLDYGLDVSKRYGAIADDSLNPQDLSKGISYFGFSLLLDPNLRVIEQIPMNDTEAYVTRVNELLQGLPPLADYAGVPLHAPVLIVPRVFERDFCRHLIDLYNQHGGEVSGFMQERDGKTVGVYNNHFKRRKDFNISDPALQASLRERIIRTLIPEIKQAFQFTVTRMERYLVACYSGGEEGFFSAHRDNTTKGTAHRRFAVTINLNAEEFEGGELRFPEYGPRSYRAPTGGAVVFSCSLLHEALPVTRGDRYAFLPFLYDEEGAKIREQNMGFLSSETIDLNKS
jgi:predicted 2-oxoglutarate/Fe(II)-dependent dioxygenase YbiX/peroxiredoxin